MAYEEWIPSKILTLNPNLALELMISTKNHENAPFFVEAPFSNSGPPLPRAPFLGLPYAGSVNGLWR